MYDRGYMDVLQQLGIEKTAAVVPRLNFGAWASKAVPVLKNFGKSVGQNLWGQPLNFAKEVQAGKALGKDSLIAEGFAAPKLWHKALMYGVPAISAVQTLRSDEPNKAQALGGLAGSVLLGTAAFGPLGMLGSIPASFAGEHLGRQLVRGTQRTLGFGNRPTPQYTSYQQPYGQQAAAQYPAQ